MTTLDELREKVRTQTETTSSELPNTTVDSYLQEAFNRTIAAETQWPSYETTWTVTQTAGDAYIAEPTTPYGLADAVSLADLTTGVRLEAMNYENAESMFLGATNPSSGQCVAFSRWAGQLVLWPAITYTDDKDYRLRGYRLPIDWIASGAAAEPDCDSRLHLCLAHYAIALAYAQQEDMELEKQYMDRWQRDAEIARTAIMVTDIARPIVMGKRVITSIGPRPYTPAYVINAP